MHKRFDPFEGMSPEEKAKAIFQQTKTYDDDFINLVEFLGGKENIQGVRRATQKDFGKLGSWDATSEFLVVTLKVPSLAQFNCKHCQECKGESESCDCECRCCSQRTFNAYLDCFKLDKLIFVEYKKELKGYADSWVEYYEEKQESNEVKK